MKEAGFHVMGVDNCPICPVFFGSAKLAVTVMNELFDNGNILV